MFKVKNRVPGGIKFNSARSFFTSFFIIKIKKNNLPLNRFAVVVSKKIDKRSVVRNKIKRLTRAVLEELHGRAIAGHDMLLIARKGILSKTKKEIRESVGGILTKGSYIK